MLFTVIVCSVRPLTVERLDLETSFLVCRYMYIFRMFLLMSSIKVV